MVCLGGASIGTESVLRTGKPDDSYLKHLSGFRKHPGVCQMNRSLSFGFCVLSNSLYAFPLFSVQNFMLKFVINTYIL